MQVIELKPIKEKYLSEMERIVKSTTVPNWSYEALSLLCGYKVINDAPVLDVKEPKHFDTESWKTTTTNLAPVTYALVRHGRWIWDKENDKMYCSECGYETENWGVHQDQESDSIEWQLPNYCENCGARMEGEEDV